MAFAAVLLGHIFLFYFLNNFLALGAEWSLLAMSISLALVITTLEHVNPRKEKYQSNFREYLWNILFFFFYKIVVQRLGSLFLIFILYPKIIANLKSETISSLWPHNLPLVAQSALAYLLMSFSAYWAHRLMHNTPLFWDFHRLHHMPRKLTWFVNFWTHPLHQLFVLSLTFTPVILMGAPEQSLLFYVVTSVVVSSLNHANFKTKSTWFNYWVPSVNEHEIHHAQDLSRANSNFGVGNLIWDHVFGTYKRATEKQDFLVGVKERAVEKNGKIFPSVIRELFDPFDIFKPKRKLEAKIISKDLKSDQ